MTTPTASTSSQDSTWADELATYLSPRCFPATHDHLVATLIGRRAPSHLLWRLSLAPRTREFQSLEDLVQQLGAAPRSVQPGSVELMS
jgi:hypothetical protein